MWQLRPRQRARHRADVSRSRGHARTRLHADADRRAEHEPLPRTVRRHQRYLQQYVPIFRRTPRFLDRIWDSRTLSIGLPAGAVSNDPRLLGDLTISMLAGEDGVLRKEFEKLIDWLRHEPVPDVINLPNSLLIAMAAPLRKAFDRPVCCTLQGEELFINGLMAPYREQALRLISQQVPQVDRFIAVSEYAAGFMSEFLAIPRDKIAVVPLGINMAGYEWGSAAKAENEFRVGYFARVAPEKGLHVLADAYTRFRGRTSQTPARLEVAGYTAPDDREYLNGVRETLDEAGLANEFSYRGVVDRDGKLEFLQSLSVLSVPATYDEPKGLFLIEAMANGVPVVQPRRGAFIEIVEKTGGGLLVEPDDADSLAEGLYALWKDPSKRAALGQSAFEKVRRHYTVADSASHLVEAYQDMRIANGSPRSNGVAS